MKKHRLLTWMTGLFLMAAACRAGLVCEESVFDYGMVSASDHAVHSFELKNTGTNTVKILKVRKTCGCVATVTSKKDVAPGGAAEIRVSVSLKGRSGEQRKVVYVHTDSKETPLLKLVTKGRVRRGVAPAVSAVVLKPAAVLRPPAAQAVTASVKSSTPRESQTLRAVPNEIRVPRTVGPDGLTVRIEVKLPEIAGIRVKGVFLPADVSFAVQRSENECWVELGPIHDVQALKGSTLVILTTGGALRIPCIVEE